eukprot:CAMPEP_0180242696 /NCGR_PEP_ID=MMETSP0987-20121128/33358_1 /TAXON_ID=697907 /ORGANISM="non described non described, Strain CCMP2293" /LENGTH=115 /DNA_ID=CAMNT_0022209821 /DNA_START=101 /DNA_END=445 /DNA_ORIENTATION=-
MVPAAVSAPTLAGVPEAFFKGQLRQGQDFIVRLAQEPGLDVAGGCLPSRGCDDRASEREPACPPRRPPQRPVSDDRASERDPCFRPLRTPRRVHDDPASARELVFPPPQTPRRVS